MRMLVRLVAAVILVLPIVSRAQSNLPTPASVFGFEVGADNHEITYDQSVAYFQKLAASSKSIRLFEAGKTTQGRTYVYAVISTPENLNKLDHYREIAQRLAHPDGLTDDQARQLAREGKAIVHIDGGLHSTERAGHQHMPLLAYDILRRANEPEMKAQLENVILMLWPTINPDGQQMVAEWETTKGTDFGGLYQEYVGHDNNRDAYMLNMIESRVMEHTWRQWEPQIIHVHHQGAPAPSRIWFPPFAEPIATWAPPLISREINALGMAMARAEDEAAHVGTTHMGDGYDAWYPGYIDYNPIFKNIAAYWTETAGSSIFPPGAGNGRGGGGSFSQPGNGAIISAPATPPVTPPAGAAGSAGQQQAVAGRPGGAGGAGAGPGGGRGGRGGAPERPQSLYASPWTPGTPWRIRDAVEYMETASLAVVEFASKYKESVLYDRYMAGRDQIARGRKEAPYAYFITQDQRDPVAAVELLRRLAFSGVRVWQLTKPIVVLSGGIEEANAPTYPAGTWVIPTDQEFIALAREVLDIQKYPEIRAGGPTGPLDQPYDAAGWTLPLTMGVNVTTAETPLTADIRSKMTLLGPMPDVKVKPTPYNLAASAAADAAPFDSVPGIGFNSSPNAAAIVPPPGKIRGSGPALAVDPAQNNAFRAVNRAWKQGATVQFLAGAPGSGVGARYVISGLSETAQSELVNSLALVADRMPATGVPLKKPRIGLFQGGTGTQDEGWTRWLLEQYNFEFMSLHTADFHAPLRDKVDVIMFASDGGLPGLGGRGGGGRGGGAPALTPEDLDAFEQFVRAGGTVVCFSGSCNGLINQFKLPVKNATTGVNRQEFSMNGSVVEVTTTPSHQVMAGMPEKANVFIDASPVFETTEGFKGTVLAKYQDSGSPLRSGFLLGEKYVNGKAAAIDAELGAGHVVLIGFRPQWRDQPFGTFRVVFNSALFAR
jgi:hypothetical protein